MSSELFYCLLEGFGKSGVLFWRESYATDYRIWEVNIGVPPPIFGNCITYENLANIVVSGLLFSTPRLRTSCYAS